MTLEQLRAVEIGAHVRLHHRRGRVTQTTPRWFMVVWDTGQPEIVKREVSHLTADMYVEGITPNRAERRAVLQPRAYKDD